MAENPIELRRARYFELSSRIAELDNERLRSLLESTEPKVSSAGWGKNTVITLSHQQVFVKHIPITKLEYENMFSTRNFYELPTYFNYGIGSAGLGIFRELVTHIKTTNWVLAGAIATFPLMYHYRIMPSAIQRVAIDESWLKKYVTYWGNAESVEHYIRDRANTQYDLVLFLEYVPFVLGEWLKDNLDKLQQPLAELRATLDFLRAKGIIHFDVHFHNVLTDGNQIYLTDFGLALDSSFSLTHTEQTFFEQHKFYDYGEVLRNVGHYSQWAYAQCSASVQRELREKYGIADGLEEYEIRAYLLDNIEQIQRDGTIALNNCYVACITKYRAIIALMQDFVVEMYNNPQKDTEFRYGALQHLLVQSGFTSGLDTSV